MKMKNKQLGVTLMELLLALVVIAVIMFMAIRYYTIAREGAKVSEAVTNVNAAVNASYEWMQGVNQADFTGISTTELINKGLLVAQDIKNPWDSSQAMTITPYPNQTNYVAITYTGIPQTACENLKQRFYAKVKEIGGSPASTCAQSGNEWYFRGGF